MNSLVTKKISQASAIQRAGRAGRIEPGICYRLWSEQGQDALEAHSPAEISRIELSDLVLNVAQWGAQVEELSWLTQPPVTYVKQAQGLLTNLDLLDEKGQITPQGESASQLGLNPRFAHMLLNASGKQRLEDASLLAAMLTDTPKALRNNDDLSRSLTQLKTNIKQHSPQKNQAAAWARQLSSNNVNAKEALSIAQLLALAFPDRVAQLRKNSDNQYLLSSGRGAQLHPSSSLITEPWLIVSDIEDNQQGGSLIRKAIAIDEHELLELFADHIESKSHIEWNAKGQLIAEQRDCLGAITIKTKKLTSLSDDQWYQAWLNYFIDNGIKSLPWSDECIQLQARLQLAFNYHLDTDSHKETSNHQSTASLQDRSASWPDFSDEALTNDLESWLMPLLTSCRTQKALKNIDLKQALMNRLGWNKVNDFELLVPEKIQVPSGSHYKIDYSQTPPVLAVKLQEMFGYQGQPSVCNGQLPLLLHLLSPARKPLQITQDLPHFWSSSYFEVRKDMRGRYPRHPWPENPMESEATRFTKNRSNKS